MAPLRQLLHRLSLIIVLLTSSLSIFGNGERTSKKIYIDLKTQSACFRLLNSTHEAGCTSAISGNVGTVHYVQGDQDFQWILKDGPHHPYVAVLNGEDFTRTLVERLYRSDRVNGIMVINLHNSTQPDGFSSVDKCPNDAYGLYHNNSEYSSCKKVEWNTPGTGLHFQDIGIPIFALSLHEDVDRVLNKCYFPFNEPIKNKARSYPVCSAEMKSRMDGAVNSVSCTRRTNHMTVSFSGQVSYCDPLGDYNVAVTMKDASDGEETRAADSVVVVGARLDATALFNYDYPASDTTVSSFVTLLAAAEALWKVKETIKNDTSAKDIMFAFFQGESFDYIGSSRMVYDMNEGKFLGPDNDGEDDLDLGDADPGTKYLPKMSLSHIDQFLELNQVGLRDEGSLWTHTDGLGRAKVSKRVDEMTQELIRLAQGVSLSIKDTVDKKQPLPPASAQWFLKHRLDIPTVVITDHHKEFTNKFYNSRYDRAGNINASDYPEGANASVKYDHVTTQAAMIADLSTTLARYLYKASTGKDATGAVAETLTGNPLTVTHLLYCFLITPNCELFLETVAAVDVDSLVTAKQPYPFYVSVDRHTTQITRLVYSLLARFTGDKLNLTEDECNAPSDDKRYNYEWMQGAKKTNSKDREGWCFKATIFKTKAVSPAWEIDGYDFDSGQYSTWTESVWGDQAIGVRLFLVPSRKFEASVLITGIFVFIVSLALVYFCNRRSHIIFRSGHPLLQQENSSEYNLL